MDGIIPTHSAGQMPVPRPLMRPIQRLDRSFTDPDALATPSNPHTLGWRIGVFLPAVLSTLGLLAAFTQWFAMNGFSWFEGVVVGLMVFTFFWISLSVSTAVAGALTVLNPRPRKAVRGAAEPLNVALLMPIYNEFTSDVFGNAAAMMSSLKHQKSPHTYTLFVLSDTRDNATAAKELRAFQTLRVSFPGKVFYRRRVENTDYKVGNLSEWIERHGGAYPAMLVLDADSLMSGPAIVELTDALAREPGAGLIQSFPMLIGAQTVFGRMLQFATRIYGAAPAAGLAKWSDGEGNFWGHNAIIRTKAFASCAGLPRLASRRGDTHLIMSHDFIEAALLRRAGWSVRFLPHIQGSYEEVPATLIDFVLRDRRWCQGNLQHMRLLRTRGFHVVSRFHLLCGIISYLVSPAWLMLLVVWALFSGGTQTNAVRYFSGYDPQVNWPDLGAGNGLVILGFVYAMLLTPKLIGAMVAPRTGLGMHSVGGTAQYIASVTTEIILSIAYAPILMVQQSISVARRTVGFSETWKPQQRHGGTYSIAAMSKFHLFETVIGALLVTGIMLGVVTLWLSPIAASLFLAIPLSALSGMNLNAYRWSARQLATPEHLNPPDIVADALAKRRQFAAVLSPSQPIAAE
ncbi:glucans biosynthesis glucosyltransferase MdoH [Octadecabacter sp. G9-8]|uniref:Glucans biosynthesis glucosyltransferase H n=1 Tax=Octadecabacter dasysiphoniae TaxID=2909341 RepID=A0ABS9CT81_9RHOB|nr:glucans biosynthesis glucosyltransferase MdoH [Octadecabacter dasysiphoniae]MCF2870432.1 glucans biosynthesis glucosyltransferase MdoH [Octadecabacter dasysiphoniae]